MSEKWQERIELATVVAWAVVTLPIELIRDEITFRRIGKAAIENEQRRT